MVCYHKDMKLYLSHSSGYNYKSELYEPLKSNLADEYDIFFPHDDHIDGVESKDILASSDVIIAEVSFPSTGQGIELGWADFQNKPIVCFYRSGSKVSSAIRFVSATVIEYESTADMIQKLRAALLNH
jgi:hypothetical protein